MIEVGRICVKIAGRDAGKKCVVLDKLEKHLVLIAGETRKRKCNLLHLEPMDQTVPVSKDMSDSDLQKALKEAGIELRQTKPKEQKEKPRKVRKVKPKKSESEKDSGKGKKKAPKDESKPAAKKDETADEEGGKKKAASKKKAVKKKSSQ